MSRASHVGLAKNNLSSADKAALLANAADNRDFIDNPLVEFAAMVGPEAMDKLCEIVGGEKIHIPEKKNFWGKLNRHVKYPEMVERIEKLVGPENLTTKIALEQVAQEFSVSFSWLHKHYVGVMS